MSSSIDNWKTQIRKGYLELCLLLMIREEKRLYGLEILERLSKLDLETKEGTLYPILNRLTAEGWLSASWVTESVKGHPRKFYSLTKEGRSILAQMEEEYASMMKIFSQLKKS